MTSNRDLGPILAAIGGAVILGAAIWGFIAVGGPGDARDRRLDDMSKGRLTDIANIARCAYNATGSVPATIDEAVDEVGWLNSGDTPQPCSLGTTPEHRIVQIGGEPEQFADITYQRLSDDTFKLCGRFRRPSDPAQACNGICYAPVPELEEFRQNAGVHCYTIKLKTDTWPN